ncbi:MAG: beta-propeller domain-containing protein [Clostridia bacterium]|nr:beta-propeller domain-containing protein [Clostridia bacterium]
MNFNRFKNEYRAMAKAETPDTPVVPQVAETAKPRFTQRPAFRFAMAALSLLLVVGISLTAVYVVPKSNSVAVSGGKPELTRCATYDDLDAVFTRAKDRADSRNIFDGMYYKSATATDTIRDDFNYAGNPEYLTLGGVEESAFAPALPEGTDGGYSKTNVQVDGVDEADIVKTDGKFVYVAKEGRVVVFDVRTPSEIAKSSTIRVDDLLDNSVYGYAHVADMFLEDDLLTVVFTAEKKDYGNDKLFTDYYFSMRADSQYGIAVYDVSDPAKPESVRYYTQEGYYVSSRRIGDYVYMVTRKSVYAGNYDGKPESVVPCRCDSAADDTITPVAPDCIYIADNSTSFITLGAVNVKDAGEPAGTVTVLGDGGTVYSSAKAMYIFGTRYDYKADDAEGAVSNAAITTNIYKFTMSGSELAFTASGSVKGSMINQFAADEYEGNLRVATTYEGYTTKEDKTVEFYTENAVTILDENLEKLGELTGLAKGEYIKSVRFNGATGYVVTFRTVDPLFAFDLSDPKNPVVTGELKIPGYSEYMHVYNDNTLLGIGQDATAESDDADMAYYQGLKIALFDVTDPDNMAEIDTYYLGDRGTTSTVEWDHKALAYYASRDVFGIPVELFRFEGEQENIYDYGEFDSNSFCVFSMGGGKKISMVSMIKQFNEDGGTFNINRGIFIGDNVVTISCDMIQINDYSTGELLGNLTF